jgi:NADH:ubiquinone oxidoreductase subunit B-like Fe-S oxidoreductase
MGMCQQHHAESGGTYLPGCPPHAEEIINGIFQFYKDVERPQYADQTEEAKLRELLKSVLEG